MPAAGGNGQHVRQRNQQRGGAFRRVQHPVVRGRELAAVDVGALGREQ